MSYLAYRQPDLPCSRLIGWLTRFSIEGGRGRRYITYLRVRRQFISTDIRKFS